MRLGGVSQKMVPLVRERADGIVEGDEKKEGREGEGKKFGRLGPVLKELNRAYHSTNRYHTEHVTH